MTDTRTEVSPDPRFPFEAGANEALGYWAEWMDGERRRSSFTSKTKSRARAVTLARKNGGRVLFGYFAGSL